MAHDGDLLQLLENVLPRCFVRYLIGEFLNDGRQTRAFLDEIIRLSEEILGRAQGSFASCEQIHGERHRGHVFRALVEGGKQSSESDARRKAGDTDLGDFVLRIVPLLRFVVHLRGDQFHFQTDFSDLRLLVRVQLRGFETS